MAVSARYAPVSSRQRERSIRVVKPVEFLPCLGRVAGFATRQCAVRTLCFHPFSELSFVWIRVAAGAGAIFKFEFYRGYRSRWHRFMAIRAKHSQVCPRQRKPRVLVLTEREPCRLEALDVVAGFAAILMWRPSELSFVNVHVTVFTLRMCDFEKRTLALRSLHNVTLFASHFRMVPFQRVFRSRMFLDGERRRRESLHCVAFCTFPAAGAPQELPLMRVFVAVHTFCEGYGCLEVPVRVAIAACNRNMLAEQGKLCLRMIESLQFSDPVPARRVMAGFAGGAETAFVRIRMACGTLGESNPFVFCVRLRAGNLHVALGARDLFVRARQRKFRLGMIEKRGRLPALHGVATRAIPS